MICNVATSGCAFGRRSRTLFVALAPARIEDITRSAIERAAHCSDINILHRGGYGRTFDRDDVIGCR